MSLERMENNVKDWLPDSFEETKELTWFAKHFVGEQSFVLLTWEGCSDKDESFRLLRREAAERDSARRRKSTLAEAIEVHRLATTRSASAAGKTATWSVRGIAPSPAVG